MISWLHPEIYPLITEKGLEPYLNSTFHQAMGVLSSGYVVITDRLHGALAAYMANRGVVYLESASKKTGGVFSTAFSGETERCLPGDRALVGVTPDLDSIIKNVRAIYKIVREELNFTEVANKSADINSRDKNQSTPLHYASANNFLQNISTNKDRPYYEIAMISNSKSSKLLLNYARMKISQLEINLRLISSSPPTLRFWEPVFANGCPVETGDGTTKKGYWRGLTLAHTSIWDHFCVFRQGARDSDRILILEDDAVCVMQNCAQIIDNCMRTQIEDVVYWGWCHKPKVYYTPPLCSHAYSVTCAAAKKLRDRIDPCGKVHSTIFNIHGNCKALLCNLINCLPYFFTIYNLGL